MQMFEYSSDVDTYCFSYKINGHIVGAFSITKPIIKKDDLYQFLHILYTKTYGRIKIKTETSSLFTITIGYNLCCFDYRISGTDVVIQMSFKYDTCFESVRTFINDLLKKDTNT